MRTIPFIPARRGQARASFTLRLARARLCWLLALPGLLTGCLSRPALVHQSFALQAPSLSKPADAASQGVLALRTVQVSPLFDDRAFVYRLGPDLYQADPYAGFRADPGRALGIAIRSALRSSGVFQDVTDPGSEVPADLALEVYANELYGDFRGAGQLAAVLSLRFVLFNEGGTGQKVLLQREYSQRVPLKEQTAAALVAGWNQALNQILSAAARDLAAARSGR